MYISLNVIFFCLSYFSIVCIFQTESGYLEERRKPDEIRLRMDRTFADRRSLILDVDKNVSVSDVKSEYPLLFTESEVKHFPSIGISY